MDAHALDCGWLLDVAVNVSGNDHRDIFVSAWQWRRLCQHAITVAVIVISQAAHHDESALAIFQDSASSDLGRDSDCRPVIPGNHATVCLVGNQMFAGSGVFANGFNQDSAIEDITRAKASASVLHVKPDHGHRAIAGSSDRPQTFADFDGRCDFGWRGRPELRGTPARLGHRPRQREAVSIAEQRDVNASVIDAWPAANVIPDVIARRIGDIVGQINAARADQVPLGVYC